MRTRSAVLLVGAFLLLPLLAAPAARAARLVGGREQAVIERAFRARAAHRHQLIVSVRASTVSPSWSAVRSLTPERGGRTTPRAVTPKLQIAYYHAVRGSERPAAPPKAVRADLQRDFRIEVVYSGSGAESIVYKQSYRSVCAGQGNFTDQQIVTVDPMSWTVRYVVDLDDLAAAVRSSQGTMLVPDVTFDAAGSSLDAVQTLSRTLLDAGCNGNQTTFMCRMSFHLGGLDPGDLLSFPPAAGIDVAVPMVAGSAGACDPNYYTLGPSLWQSGAGAALVRQLGLVGGTLPARPYAPISVSWPGGSAQGSDGFATSPCQGDGSACSDDFHWQGTVALVPVPAG
jgi:hypothetical protein